MRRWKIDGLSALFEKDEVGFTRKAYTRGLGFPGGIGGLISMTRFEMDADGLEFPVVFIIGCEQNLLPLSIEDMVSDSREERRLFYVGMTRAKEVLYLTHARRRRLFGQWMSNPPSPYLGDIEHQLKEYDPAQPPRRRKDKPGSTQLEFFKV